MSTEKDKTERFEFRNTEFKPNQDLANANDMKHLGEELQELFEDPSDEGRDFRWSINTLRRYSQYLKDSAESLDNAIEWFKNCTEDSDMKLEYHEKDGSCEGYKDVSINCPGPVNFAKRASRVDAFSKIADNYESAFFALSQMVDSMRELQEIDKKIGEEIKGRKDEGSDGVLVWHYDEWKTSMDDPVSEEDERNDQPYEMDAEGQQKDWDQSLITLIKEDAIPLMRKRNRPHKLHGFVIQAHKNLTKRFENIEVFDEKDCSLKLKSGEVRVQFRDDITKDQMLIKGVDYNGEVDPRYGGNFNVRVKIKSINDRK